MNKIEIEMTVQDEIRYILSRKIEKLADAGYLNVGFVYEDEVSDIVDFLEDHFMSVYEKYGTKDASYKDIMNYLERNWRVA